MARTARLKVFQARFGFHDSVVAAPSQAAALRAWGTHQNLFAEGQAWVATDEETVAVALAHPGAPLRRAIGSEDRFALQPTTLPTVPDLPGRGGGPSRTRSTPKVRADRAALDAAERAVAVLDRERERQERGFEARQRELDSEIAAARAAHAKARASAEAALMRARKAYRRAGGTA